MDNMNLDLYEELNQLDIDDLTQEMTIEDLLHIMVEKGSSDLHLKAGCAPMIRVDGELVPITYELLSAEVVRRMIESILTEEQKAKFIVEKELDLAYSVPGLSRFRVNVFMQRNTWATAIRVIPSRPFSIDELKLPHILKDLAMKPRGLILVTGPTGSGKSTIIEIIESPVYSIFAYCRCRRKLSAIPRGKVIRVARKQFVFVRYRTCPA